MSAATSVDLVVAHVAALRLGLVVVPVNGAYPAREIDHIVGDCAPAACVVDDDRAACVRRARARRHASSPTPAVDLPDADPPALDTRATRRRRAALLHVGHHRRAEGRDAHPRQPAGELRGAAAGLALDRRTTAWCWRCRCSTCTASASACTARCSCGASAVLLPRFDPDAVLDAARDHDATLFFGVPTMYARLAASARGSPSSPRLRLCVSGSAPLPAALHDELAAAGRRRACSSATA